MKPIHISDYCNEHGQTKAAEILGCTQGAVSQMVSANRNIFFVIEKGKETTFYELKKPGRSSAA